MKRPNSLTCTFDSYGYRVLYRGHLITSVGQQQRSQLVSQVQQIEQTRVNRMITETIVSRLRAGTADRVYTERVAEIDRNSPN